MEDCDGDVRSASFLERQGEGHNTVRARFISGCISYSVDDDIGAQCGEQLLLGTSMHSTRDSWDTRDSNYDLTRGGVSRLTALLRARPVLRTRPLPPPSGRTLCNVFIAWLTHISVFSQRIPCTKKDYVV